MSGLKWTDEELANIKENKIPSGRSLNGVRNKRTELGMRVARIARKKWSEDEVAKLRDLLSDGYSAKKIHDLGILDQSKNAIQKQMCRLGLAKKNKIFKFPEDVRQRFKKFLSQQWEGKTPEELMILWNKENNKFQTNKRRVISVLTLLNIKITYGEVQKINNARKKEQKIHATANSASKLSDLIRSDRIKIMRSRFEKGRDIWTGLQCVVCDCFDQED